MVTPGFIDLHTHYDGQVTWDDALEPSASNGVSTVVLGNCGVGFAPVRPADHAELIDMMEGVEDIPGTALADGIPWGAWETFPQYLDVVDSRTYATNVVCHISHGPLRYYVMGERAYDDQDATAEDVDRMATIVAEAMAAGAAGFSTNRFQIHKSRTGRIVPGTFAPHEELMAIAAKVGEAGHGIDSGDLGRHPSTPTLRSTRCPNWTSSRDISIEHRPTADFHDRAVQPGRRHLPPSAEGCHRVECPGRPVAAADHSTRRHDHDNAGRLSRVHIPPQLQEDRRSTGRAARRRDATPRGPRGASSARRTSRRTRASTCWRWW